MIKFLGNKKKPEKGAMAPGKGFIPVDKTKDMSNKGFTEPEIIDSLRKEGFNSQEIDSALTQSLKLGVTGEDSMSPGGGLPTLQDLQRNSQMETPAPPIMQMDTPPMQQDLGGGGYYQDNYSTEEVVESIVHEKMGEVQESLIDFKAKNSEIERRMADLHNQLAILTKSRTDSEEKILNKLDSFKEEINENNATMASLERAFKEALPALIESVRALTDLVQRIKRETA